MKTTGHPPGLLQDDCRKLFRWFADRVDARWTLRRVLAEYSKDDGCSQALDKMFRKEKA